MEESSFSRTNTRSYFVVCNFVAKDKDELKTIETSFKLPLLLVKTSNLLFCPEYDKTSPKFTNVVPEEKAENFIFNIY